MARANPYTSVRSAQLVERTGFRRRFPRRNVHPNERRDVPHPSGDRWAATKAWGGTAKRESLDALLCCATHSACSFFPQPISGRTQSSLLTAKRRKLKIRERSESLHAVVCVYVRRVRRPPSCSPKERERKRGKKKRESDRNNQAGFLFTFPNRKWPPRIQLLRRSPAILQRGTCAASAFIRVTPNCSRRGEIKWRLVGNPLGLD